MHKPYLLLRNNKQQGPFTLDELLQQSLKPFDLVWVDGKSVGWKYPNEIDVLKNHIPDVQQRVEVAVQTRVAEQPITQLGPQTKKQGVKKIYVSMPGGVNPSLAPIEEESFSQKLEKKAEELYRRAQAYAEKKNEDSKPSIASSATPNTELQTNYARSLDDIKEEYSSWLYAQKTNRKGAKRKMSITVTATILILLAGFTTAKFVFSKKQKSIASVETSHQLADSTTSLDLKSNQGQRTNSKKTSTASKRPIDIAKKKTTKVSKEKKSSPIARNGALAQKPGNSSVPLNELVQMSAEYVPNQNGIPDFVVTVHNNSDQALSFVAVDLYYYQNDGSVGGKKTIYFNGLSPHASISQNAPANRNVVLKMGLIRNEDGELFYAKQ